MMRVGEWFQSMLPSGNVETLGGKIQRTAELIVTAEGAVALTGAGISTPSGIPDFRGSAESLWEAIDPMGVASIWGFQSRPEAFYEWARPLAKTILEAEPNPAHEALARLESMGLLDAIITQNIDELHQKAGSERVLEVHGNLRKATCLDCYEIVSTERMLHEVVEEGKVPRHECGGVLKPNIVLFGERLLRKIFAAAEEEIRRSDLLLVAGSSLEVSPVGDLPRLARQHAARVIIVNHQETPFDDLAEVVIREDVAEILPRIAEACRHRRRT